MKNGVCILAAGASRRMGQPKLLLPWGQGSVVEHLLAVWKRAGASLVAVVTAPDNPPLAAELDRLGIPPDHCILNPAPELGMMSSVLCGARWPGWRDDLTHIALSLGDQPLVRAETLTKLLDFADSNPGLICQPSRAGRPKHPIVFPREAWRELAESNVAMLRDFLGSPGRSTHLMPSDDSGLDLDLDTAEDYQRARALRAEDPSISTPRLADRPSTTATVQTKC